MTRNQQSLKTSIKLLKNFCSEWESKLEQTNDNAIIKESILFSIFVERVCDNVDVVIGDS